MTRKEFETKMLTLLTEAADGGMSHFVLLYKDESSPGDTYVISDAPKVEFIYEALKGWVETYEKKGVGGVDRRVFLDGKEIKEDPIERPN